MFNGILLTASDPRVAFSIGSLEVRWYGIIIVFAMLLGLLYVCLQAKKINLDSDDGVELFLWVIPLAIVFARIFYVLPRADEYFPWESTDDFVRAIAIWDGGITIIGGIVGGILGGIFFTLHHRKKCNFGQVADLVVVPLLLGQIIGRLGNFINQEAFGLPIKNEAFHFFPFGVYITDPSGVEAEFRDLVYSNTPGWFCATFFYEMVWNFIGLIMCYAAWKNGKNKKYPGILLIFYFFWYCLGRVWLEFLRLDAVPVTKIACGVVVPIAIIAFVVYIAVRNSQLSYKKIDYLLRNDTLNGVPLTRFDIKNYRFVGKILSNPKNPFRLLYGRNAEFYDADIEEYDYYFVSRDYKQKFKKLMKEEYTA